MPQLGLSEAILVGLALLIAFGPKRLPALAKGLGESIRNFRKELGE